MSDYVTKTNLLSALGRFKENADQLYEKDAVVTQELNQHDSRLQNLEEAHGSYHEVDVKSVYTIPTGKGSNWLVDKLRGVSRVENNLVAPSNLRTRKDFGITITANADGTITVSGTAEASTNLDFTLNNFGTVGHSYVVCGGKSNGNIVINDGTHVARDGGAGAYLANATGTVKLQFPITNGVTYNVTITPCVTDLSVYFNGTIPSDADSISEIQTNYPWLLTPSSYGTSAVNTVYEGVRSKSRNLWDEVWELGGYNTNTGEKVEINTRIRSKTGFGVLPNVEYFFRFGTGSGNVFFYDWDGNYISRIYFSASNSFTTPSNCFIVKIAMADDYGIVYHNDICINQSDSLNGTYTPYRAPVTLTFPSPVSLKSAGDVAEEYYPATGRVTHPLYVGDMGDLPASSYDNSNAPLCSTTALMSIIKKVDNTNVANILVTGYVARSRNDLTNAQMTISVNGGGVIVFNDPNISSSWTKEQIVAYMTGKILTVELATPAADTYVDPILDNLIPTEADGTIESILTNPVDDSMTLGYINL